MLRSILLIIVALLFVGALVLVTQAPEAWPALLMASLLVVGTVYERFHYRGAPVSGASRNWEPTAERFLDEESGRPVTVWFDPASGERRYVEEGEAPPAG